MKFYWNVTLLIHVCIVSGGFHVTVAELKIFIIWTFTEELCHILTNHKIFISEVMINKLHFQNKVMINTLHFQNQNVSVIEGRPKLYMAELTIDVDATLLQKKPDLGL